MYKNVLVVSVTLFCCPLCALLTTGPSKNIVCVFSILSKNMDNKQPVLLLPEGDLLSQKNNHDYRERIQEALLNTDSPIYRFCKLLYTEKLVKIPGCSCCPSIKWYYRNFFDAEQALYSTSFKSALRMIYRARKAAPCRPLKHKYTTLIAFFNAIQEFWPICLLDEPCDTTAKKEKYIFLKNILFNEGPILYAEQKE